MSRLLTGAGLFFAGSCFVVAYRKLIGHPVTLATHDHWGFPRELTWALMAIEASAGTLLLRRQTAFAGGAIFACIAGAAAILHAWHGDLEKVALPAVFAALAVVYCFLIRKPARR